MACELWKQALTHMSEHLANKVLVIAQCLAVYLVLYSTYIIYNNKYFQQYRRTITVRTGIQ